MRELCVGTTWSQSTLQVNSAANYNTDRFVVVLGGYSDTANKHRSPSSCRRRGKYRHAGTITKHSSVIGSRQRQGVSSVKHASAGVECYFCAWHFELREILAEYVVLLALLLVGVCDDLSIGNDIISIPCPLKTGEVFYSCVRSP